MILSGINKYFTIILVTLTITMSLFPQSNLYTDVKANIYPNPFNKVLRIDLVSEQRGMIVITLWNLTGQKIDTIFKFNCKNPPCGTIQIQYSVPDLASGVYIYLITFNERISSVGKLILLR